MQATSGLSRTTSRSVTGALLFVLAAAALLLGGAAGYWARGLAAPTPAVVTQPANIPSAVTNNPAANERHRQQLINANTYDGTLPAVNPSHAKGPQHS